MGKKVSVILTSYNSNEVYLKKAIKSVLNQSYDKLELIIVNDGSQNDVCDKLIKEFNSNKVLYIKQSNKGLACARNTGIKASTGHYICFIDDDDIWLQNKVKECVNRFEKIEVKDKKIGLVFSQCNVIDEKDYHLGVFGFKVSGNIYEKLLGKNIIGPPSSVMIKRDVLKRVGCFNEIYKYAEDIELWYRITKYYTVYSVNKPLVNYRFRKNSLSKNHCEMAKYTEKALLDELKVNKGSNSKKILSKYYSDFAYLFFSNNDCKSYKKYFNKALSASLKNLFNFKLIFGYVVVLFGENVVKYINRLRGRNDNISNSYNTIIEIKNY